MQLVAGKDAELFVVGTVPKDIVRVWVEVSRDTQVVWKSTADGFIFDKFAMWQGRLETWFDGDSTPVPADGIVYNWLSSPGQSRSRRFFRNTAPGAPQNWPTETQYEQRISDYYGIVDWIDDSRATTRPDLEVDARASLMRAFPAPLGIDIPQDAPLLPNAPVTINQLMPGVVVPIQTRSTCRQVGATPILETVKVRYDTGGEHVTVTLVTSQAWEVAPPDNPEDPVPGEGD